jgi:hypothetical protein
MPMKICQCGHAHFDLPKRTFTQDGLIYFNCHNCASTITISEKRYKAYVLGNFMPKEEDEDQDPNNSTFGPF